MLRKILKISLLIIFIGFISAFIRGYKGHIDTSKLQKQVVSNNSEVQKQDLIDEETITSILNTDKKLEESSNQIQEKQNNIDKTKIDNKEEIVQKDVSIEDTNIQNENSIIITMLLFMNLKIQYLLLMKNILLY